MILDPRTLDRRVRIERPVPNGAADGAGLGEWHPVATVWASKQDMLPSRGERLADGINVAARPARIRMRYRTDVGAAMRLVLLKREGDDWVVDRVMEIIAGPAELGTREGLEFMVEDYSSPGNAA